MLLAICLSFAARAKYSSICSCERVLSLALPERGRHVACHSVIASKRGSTGKAMKCSVVDAEL